MCVAKIVAPGLIDIHTHAGRSKEGPELLLQDGVAGWVDAGSAGADNIDQIVAVARGGLQIGRALVNIARTGVVSPGGELHDMNRANVALAQGAIARPRDIVVGCSRLGPCWRANRYSALSPWYGRLWHEV